MSLTIKQAFEALSDACGAGMKNPFFVMRRLKDSFADVASKVDGGGDKVIVTPITDSGTKIATIKVNNTTSELYAPENEGASIFFDGTSAAIASGNINSGTATHTTWEYTATENCWVMVENGKGVQDTSTISIDGKKFYEFATGFSYNSITVPVLLKAGQKYKITGLGAYCSYTVRKTM